MAATEVVAIANFSGEDDGELSFKKGDTIKVIEKVDENWSKGQVGSVIGIFPVNFVTAKRSRPSVPPLPRSTIKAGAAKSPTQTPEPATESPRNSPTVNGVSRKIQPCARALYTFSGEKKDELSFSEGVKIRLLRRIDDNWLEGELNGNVGIFPQQFVKIEVGLPSKDGESVLAGSGKPYARGLCNFHGDSHDDLQFERGDLIELVSWAGEGWMKGRTSDDNTGVFPASFVQVIQPLPVSEAAPREIPSVVISTASPTEQQNSAPQPKPRKSSVSSAPKPVPRRRTSPGVPKRSAPCPPGSSSPSHRQSPRRPRTPDFESPKPPMRRISKQRPLTMARSIDVGVGDRKTRSNTMAVPRPRKRGQAVSMVMDCTQIDLEIEELLSKLALEQKMLRSAEALLKVSTSEEKRNKLEGSLDDHHKQVKLCEQQLEDLRAERKEQTQIKNSVVMPRPPSPPREDPKVVKEMMRQKRLDELMETERVYLNDMSICYRDIMPAMSQIKGLDINVLFGNLGDVVKVTEDLLAKLETDQMEIGKTFNSFSSRLCNVYGVYCRNNEDAMATLEKYLENPELSSNIQKTFISAMPEDNNHYWDLLSLIIKPVQRITKYPLLIGELQKETDEEHPDWSHLQRGHDAMVGANSRINEFKRRKDLVDKYTGGAEPSIGSRISLHSVRKKMTRVKQSFTQMTGLRHKTVDVKFDEEEGHYMESEALVKGMYRVTLAWGDQLQETWKAHVNLVQGIQEAWSDEEDQSNSLVECYHDIINNTLQEKMKYHLAHIQDHVIQPLQQLLTLFQGPSTLIAKRKDKLLDYDHLQHALEKTKDKDPDKLKQLNEQCTAAKRNYEALNTQLLEELPLFRTKVAKMVSWCIAVLLRAHNQLYLEWAGLLQSVTSSEEGVGLVELHSQLLQEACHQLTQLSVVPSWLGSHVIKSPVATSSRPHLVVSPTESYSSTTLPIRGSSKRNKSTTDVIDGEDQRTVKSPQVGQLYLSLYSFDAQDTAELSVAKGDTVVLVTPHDQLGSSEWWLVAKGNTEGYVPSVYLDLVNEDEGSHNLKDGSHSPEVSHDPRSGSHDHSIGSHDNSDGSHDLTNESPEPLVTSPTSGSHDSEGQYQVIFSFDASSEVELSVQEGECVRLIEAHDLTGNNEWWLVKNEGGAKGYVPANYLQ